MNKQFRFSRILVHFILIFFSLLFIAPFIWMFITAIKTSGEAFSFPPKFIPNKVQLGNFIKAWTSMPFGTFLKNSITVTGLGVIGQLLSSSLVAYGFGRYDFKWKNGLFVLLLSTMMIPWDVIAIPQYMLFNKLGWINTLKPLIVPTFFGAPYFIFLMRQFLMGIPRDMEEAARIDGANDFQIYYKIFMPLMIPILVVAGVFQMINAWNDYLGPLIFLNDMSKFTLTLGLMQFKGMYSVDITSIMATTLLICIPPIVVFFIAQRYIMDGIQSTGLK